MIKLATSEILLYRLLSTLPLSPPPFSHLLVVTSKSSSQSLPRRVQNELWYHVFDQFGSLASLWPLHYVNRAFHDFVDEVFKRYYLPDVPIRGRIQLEGRNGVSFCLVQGPSLDMDDCVNLCTVHPKRRYDGYDHLNFLMSFKIAETQHSQFLFRVGVGLFCQ